MLKKNKTIFFDMDGTLVNLYEPKDWLERIQKEDVSLYEEAKPLLNLKEFSACCRALKNKGYRIGIISYLPWEASRKYKQAVKKVKENYLKKHFKDIEFDEINICDYTIPKDSFAKPGDVLIDDDIRVRRAWNKGKAYTADTIVAKLRTIHNI